MWLKWVNRNVITALDDLTFSHLFWSLELNHSFDTIPLQHIHYVTPTVCPDKVSSSQETQPSSLIVVVRLERLPNASRVNCNDNIHYGVSVYLVSISSDALQGNGCSESFLLKNAEHKVHSYLQSHDLPAVVRLHSFAILQSCLSCLGVSRLALGFSFVCACAVTVSAEGCNLTGLVL